MRVSKKFLITEDIVIKYSEISQDMNPIHLDDEYAKKSIFKRRIAHGMLLGGFISGIIANDYPGEGSIYLQQIINFVKPCYIGDEIDVIIELIDKTESKYKLSTKIVRKETTLVDGEALILKL